MRGHRRTGPSSASCEFACASSSPSCFFVYSASLHTVAMSESVDVLLFSLQLAIARDRESIANSIAAHGFNLNLTFVGRVCAF